MQRINRALEMGLIFWIAFVAGILAEVERDYTGDWF